jgi:hypothetical protein
MIGHRRQREAQILRELGKASAPIPALVEAMYKGLDSRLKGAAGRSVLAHLLDLENKSQVTQDGEIWTLA